jgi:hypothetical protein
MSAIALEPATQLGRFGSVEFPMRGAAMAKKDKKAGKNKSAKTPKEVGGVKLPKSLRESGDMLSSLVTSPVARELVADALIAIAGVLVGNKKTRDAASDAGAQAASGAKDLGRTATGAVAEVVTEAARRILPSSITGEEGGQGSRSAVVEHHGGRQPQPGGGLQLVAQLQRGQ